MTFQRYTYFESVYFATSARAKRLRPDNRYTELIHFDALSPGHTLSRSSVLADHSPVVSSRQTDQTPYCRACRPSWCNYSFTHDNLCSRNTTIRSLRCKHTWTGEMQRARSARRRFWAKMCEIGVGLAKSLKDHIWNFSFRHRHGTERPSLYIFGAVFACRRRFTAQDRLDGLSGTFGNP